MWEVWVASAGETPAIFTTRTLVAFIKSAQLTRLIEWPNGSISIDTADGDRWFIARRP